MAEAANDGEPLSDDDIAGGEGEKEDEDDEEGEGKDGLEKPPEVFVLVVKQWDEPPKPKREYDRYFKAVNSNAKPHLKPKLAGERLLKILPKEIEEEKEAVRTHHAAANATASANTNRRCDKYNARVDRIASPQQHAGVVCVFANNDDHRIAAHCHYRRRKRVRGKPPRRRQRKKEREKRKMKRVKRARRVERVERVRKARKTRKKK